MFDGNSRRAPRHTSSLSFPTQKTHHHSLSSLSLPHPKKSRTNEIGKIEWSLNSNDDELLSTKLCRGGSDFTQNTRGDCAQCRIVLPLHKIYFTYNRSGCCCSRCFGCRHTLRSLLPCVLSTEETTERALWWSKSWLRFGKLIIAQECQPRQWFIDDVRIEFFFCCCSIFDITSTLRSGRAKCANLFLPLSHLSRSLCGAFLD